jgi:hypothetical protein
MSSHVNALLTDAVQLTWTHHSPISVLVFVVNACHVNKTVVVSNCGVVHHICLPRNTTGVNVVVAKNPLG